MYKTYCNHKFPYFPHPLDKTYNRYVCQKCLDRYEKFKDNPKYLMCDQCWSINRVEKMEEDRNAYGTFYTCKDHIYRKRFDKFMSISEEEERIDWNI